jgi:outer membrane protein OmpA-like peptidoglycan-associated protein
MTVRGLDSVDREEFPIGSGSIVGASFATVAVASPADYITIVRPEAVVGDADIARILRQGAVVDTVVESMSLPVFWDGHPTLWKSWMIFASDRHGSIGGTDLWYCRRDGNAWTTPRQLHRANTPCDELSPFVRQSDGVLWWATAGGPTLGGYDVVYASLRDDGDSLTLGPPRNPGAPVNSPSDELFPVATDSLRFASNRRARTDFDVYVIVQPGQLPSNPLPPRTSPLATTTPPMLPHEADSATVTGTVLDQATRRPVADAEVTARNQSTKSVIASARTDTSGTWRLTVPVERPVDVIAQSGTLFLDRQTISLPRSAARTTVPMERPLALPTTFVLRVNFPTAVFDAPYERTLDSNGLETDQGWQDALDEVARNVALSGPRLRRLVLVGHTDDVGTDASNTKLGRQRVEFIIDELERRGVERSLMEGRSAGEQLLPTRRTGESEDTWRKRARRVELVKVLQQ